MDLRVYVDGVARIICDLTPTTTVHDIIIALAQYKGKAGRYSLIERAPDGAQRTLSPHELTHELIHHPDWTYILRQNLDFSQKQKRSKSLDGRKTPLQQQSTVEIPSAVTSSSSSSSTSGHFRTVYNNNNGSATLSSSSSSIKSSEKKKHSHLRHIFPSENINNNNNNHLNSGDSSPPVSFFIEKKRSSRTPVQIIEQDLGTLDNQHATRRSRPKSALSSSSGNESSAFRIVHNPNDNSPHLQQQQQQYIALLKMLKSQEIQVEQQQKELSEKQKEIAHREQDIHLIDHDSQLTTDCPVYSEEYSKNELDKEFDYERKLHSNYEHLQDQITRCSTTIEQKRQLQEQIQSNIEQIHSDVEQIQKTILHEKKDINQYQHDLERSTASLTQQEDLVHVLTQHNDEIERIIQERRQQINNLENELIKLDDMLINT
ncbi:unnamed protein product [Adineta ricciae]|uniref:Ras-associating domain-containing protein n=1 Tax=Adineta ricciae TaxID=249248 RepID=A0A813T8B1_ADIRI|nr:unnamed protein product [Adineta ricciae]